jgi:surfeit locus 1 family protein
LPPETAWAALKPDDYAYRHVTVTGTFEHDKETHVFRPLSAETSRGRYSGVGDLVLTPLRLADGATVIVNRGFVPQDRIDPATRKEGQIAGTVTISGLMREPETRNLFTPVDDMKTGTWFTRDPIAIAQFWHLDRAAPFTIDADGTPVPGGLPQGGETVLTIPNNHLSYALTWFGLAIGLCSVFAAYVWKRVKAGADLELHDPFVSGNTKR